MSTSETVLRADAALTADGPLADAEVAFTADGVISYVGPVREERECTHHLRGQVLMPGLVNGHTHSAMTLQRGISDDDGFMAWLRAVQAVEQHLTREDVEVGLQLAMLEMIETGTTTFADMYYWDAELLELVAGAGMRVLAAPASFAEDTVGFPNVSPMNGSEVTKFTEDLARQFAGHDQIRIAFGPHAPYTSPPGFLHDIAARAQRVGIAIHTHVSESEAEGTQIAQEYGASPVQHLAALGVFDVPTLAAHCVHVSAEDIETLRDAGVAVSHNPVSNLKLGNGIAPLPDLIAAGVPLTLGTDGVASNNSLDLFEEIKLATILHRGARRDSTAVTAAEVLEIATWRGAEAIGFPETGSLAAGKQADIIALDVSGTTGAQCEAATLVSHLGFAASGRDVRRVFIGGREVFADGTHMTLDAEVIKLRARRATARLRHAAGL